MGTIFVVFKPDRDTAHSQVSSGKFMIRQLRDADDADT
jgi:hypothetical protein